MRVFDFHTHIYPDAIAPRAIANVTQSEILHAQNEGTLAGLLREMETAHISGALNLPLALSPDSERGVNAWAAQLHADERPIYSLGSVHPATPDPEARLRWIQSRGLPGIKLHSEFQKFRPSDPRMFPIYAACEKLGLFILFHTGKDLIFQGEPQSNPVDFIPIVEHFPKLKIVLAHMGGIDTFSTVAPPNFHRNPNVFFDLAYVMPYASGAQLAERIRMLGVQQVLFGTDSPWISLKDHLQSFLKTPLTQSEFDAILWDNAQRLLCLNSPNMT